MKSDFIQSQKNQTPKFHIINMDFKENLKTIASIKIYDEYQDFPSLSIPQMVFFSEEDEKKNLIKKELSRNLKISKLTGGWIFAPPEISPKNGFTPTLNIIDEAAEMTVLETKLKFLNLKKEKFTSWEDAYNLVIQRLDELTLNPQIWFEERKYFPNWSPSGPLRLVDRIFISTNTIAHQSRIGPGNVAIIGSGVLKHLDLNIYPEFKSSVKIVVDHNIDPNKVICIRTSQSSHQGEVNSCVMSVVYGERDFFWGLPENWEQFASWFWIED